MIRKMCVKYHYYVSFLNGMMILLVIISIIFETRPQLSFERFRVGCIFVFVINNDKKENGLNNILQKTGQYFNSCRS